MSLSVFLAEKSPESCRCRFGCVVTGTKRPMLHAQLRDCGKLVCDAGFTTSFSPRIEIRYVFNDSSNLKWFHQSSGISSKFIIKQVINVLKLSKTHLLVVVYMQCLKYLTCSLKMKCGICSLSLFSLIFLHLCGSGETENDPMNQGS